MTLLIFVVTLAAIGLVHGAAMHFYSYFPQHSSPILSPNLHTQALLLQVVPQKSAKSSGFSASAKPLFHLFVRTVGQLVPVMHVQLKLPQALPAPVTSRPQTGTQRSALGKFWAPCQRRDFNLNGGPYN